MDDWSQGVPLGYLEDLCAYWEQRYDWRVLETRLNELPQFRTAIGGLGIHFVPVRSPHQGAFPLVLTNGWPGSIVEYLDVLGPLTDPTGYGGDAATRSTWCAPRCLARVQRQAGRARLGCAADRRRLAHLDGQARLRALRQRLGHERHDQHGSAGTRPARGIHPAPLIAAPDPATFDDLTAAERDALDALAHAQWWEDGYSVEQATKPQTVGYSLVDSPAGLCAWIVEKLRSWTDCDSRPENVLTRDQMLDNVMLYWVTRSGASSARLYWESIRQVQEWFTRATGDVVEVPAGRSIFPKENPRPLRRWAANRYTDIRYWHELGRGGHFAALEQPAAFVGGLRAFFRLVR